MDLRLDADEVSFRERLREWLDHVTLPGGLRDYGATPTAADVPAARAWQAQLARSGWAGLSWPLGYGGASATPVQQALYAEELAQRELPRQGSFVTTELAGPALIAQGSVAQRQQFLGPILDGRHLWCQLFSEPDAGSDLASLRARAVRRTGGWDVSGQKVWTSGAHYADFGLLLARTDPDDATHRGLTCFLLPMDRPDLDVRPIRQLDGEEKFNEVFLDGVRVEDDEVLGDVGGGWQVALSILGRERRMLGAIAIPLRGLLADLAARIPPRQNELQKRWAALAIDVELLRWTWLRLLSVEVGAADPRMSALKLISSRLQREVPDLARDILGGAFLASDGAVWQQRLLAALGATIAGGTSEIQRSILATRVLGLPR